MREDAEQVNKDVFQMEVDSIWFAMWDLRCKFISVLLQHPVVPSSSHLGLRTRA